MIIAQQIMSSAQSLFEVDQEVLDLKKKADTLAQMLDVSWSFSTVCPDLVCYVCVPMVVVIWLYVYV